MRGELMTTTFSRLRNEGLLQPLMDTPQPNPLSKKCKRESFHEFFQIPSHDTNNYKHLHHEIQDLINEQKIAGPENKRHK